ncbi:MAG: hypothetical protein L0L86_12225, partial [Lactococcus lactis]|nr:hypothetical protein [Lactococcus lactis]
MTVNTLAEITNLNFAYTIEQLSLTELIKQLPEDRQRFYMFGTPIYNNLGDLAISEAQKRFFGALGMGDNLVVKVHYRL